MTASGCSGPGLGAGQHGADYKSFKLGSDGKSLKAVRAVFSRVTEWLLLKGGNCTSREEGGARAPAGFAPGAVACAAGSRLGLWASSLLSEGPGEEAGLEPHPKNSALHRPWIGLLDVDGRTDRWGGRDEWMDGW